MLRRWLPWLVVGVTLLVAAGLLFGPLWDTAEGENPLNRPSGVDWDAVLQLAMPTVVVAVAVVVALVITPRNGNGTGRRDGAD